MTWQNFYLKLAVLFGIILLSACTEKEAENTPPVALFTAGNNTGTIETLFTFDASASYDLEDSASDLVVRWDWENDGVWDTDFSYEKIVRKGFNKKNFYHVTLEVKDTEGLSSEYTEIINVEDYFLLDSRDNRQYKTVKIGSQLWMAENLNYEAYEGSYCPENKADNCLTYGKLYTWDAANFVCPDGWSLPTKEDWNLLFDVLGENAAEQMKSDHGWRADLNGTNSSGFNILPASYLTNYGEFMALGGYAWFWTNTEQDPNSAWSVMFSYSSNEPEQNFYHKLNAFSVRCLKN